MANPKSPVKKQDTHSLFGAAHDERFMSLYDLMVWHQALKYGGFFNGHAHLDRADTLAGKYLEHINLSSIEASNYPLSVKQNLVGDYHRGVGYTAENLYSRGAATLERLIAYGTREVHTNIDATPDLPEDGLLAINVWLRLKKEFAGRIEIRIAPTPIFGYKHDRKDKHDRWEVFKEAARQCDYLSLLPEKDDFNDEAERDGRVGFKHHIRMGIELACELGKEVQFHLDQKNVPGERGTERFLEMIEGLDLPSLPGGEPAIWIIHMISPSAYSEERFARLVDGLLRYHIGVIVCPSAAASMRQLRAVNAPTRNSIARVPELIKRRVPLRVGSDNICDVLVPQSDGNMLTEIKEGGVLTRMNDPSIWAKLACGEPLNNVDIATVGRGLYEDRKANREINPEWIAAVD